MTDFIIIGLAVWRLASLLAREEGPVQIFDRFRHFVGIRYTEGDIDWTNNFAKGLSCVHCNSIWLGAVASVLYFTTNGSIVLMGIAWALALSSIAVVVDEITN